MTSDHNTLQKFFTGRRFSIPPYQRSFAWLQPHVQDLLDDVRDSLELATPHYLGAFVLCSQPPDPTMHVVDGQQRLTTLLLLLSTLIKRFENQEDKIVATAFYIRERGGDYRLKLPAPDNVFFEAFLRADETPQPVTSAQRRLRDASRLIRQRVTALTSEDALRWFCAVEKFEVLEFVKATEGEAIRIFETVNDRGRALTTTDKVKSHLAYYSNRHLHGQLDATISATFGDIFRSFDRTKDIAATSDSQVNLVGQSSFTEDWVLRYHFLSYPSEYHNYRATTEDVLDTFLKKALKDAAPEQERLAHFITHYIADLAAFFAALEGIIADVSSKIGYWRVFTVLSPGSRYYPLIVRLRMRGFLDAPLPTDPAHTFLDLIENVVFREEKILRGQSEKALADYARKSGELSSDVVETQLREFGRSYLNELGLKQRIKMDTHSESPFLRYFFLAYAEELAAKDSAHLGREDLIQLLASSPEIEHILPKTPSIPLPGRGFSSAEDYSSRIEKVGNLTLLEKRINSACGNVDPGIKAASTHLYPASRFRDVQQIAARIHTQGVLWDKGAIEARTEELCDFAVRRWFC